jgi:hypothetical protein
MTPARKALAAGALAVAAMTGGAIGATFLGTANAQDSTSSTTAPSSNSSGSTAAAPQQGGPGGAPDWSHAGHQANGKTESLLTGDALTKATAAAKAAVPGATPQRVETDADGDEYEVHMTKSDGSIVTVKLDSNFKVTRTIDGMG